ncbi:MAG: hypothetical protein V5A31_10860 [Haloferacaceae archaeon]
MSASVRDLAVLWVAVDDEPGPESDRASVERGAVALLSNAGREPVAPREETWLGRHSRSAAIREPGLWNVEYVEERHDPGFLDRFAAYVRETGSD